MLFNSYIFVLVFLPVSLLIYYVLNYFKFRKISMALLVLFSLVFYSYNNIKLTWVLVTSIVGNYLLAYCINHFWQKWQKKCILLIGITANVCSIFYFKYFDFFLSNLNTLFHEDFQLRHMVLPLGISFYTFQLISYLIDTYRGETSGYSFLEYAAFVSFFPQLVAGPIVLHKEIIPQFRDAGKWKFNHDNFANGIYVFAVGMFKKVLIADTLGRAVTWGWNNVDNMTSMEIIIVMLSYTFQIYFDFSGYSDMAVGIGKMFNIELPINFDSPYKSYSILEFWKRWHMTLTRFLRNYIYISLGGSKKGAIRTYINIMVVFLLSGLWHGANWTFVLWGGMHGIAQILNRIFKKSWDKCNQVFQWLCTFLFINIMWLLFRADSVEQALSLVKRMCRMESLTVRSELYNCYFYALPEIDWIAQQIKPLYYIQRKVSGIYMWGTLLTALFICLNLNNLYEKSFVPTWKKAVISSTLLVWSIITFSDITVFLYFNF